MPPAHSHSFVFPAQPAPAQLAAAISLLEGPFVTLLLCQLQQAGRGHAGGAMKLVFCWVGLGIVSPHGIVWDTCI